jgi:hypothetical protein
VAGYSGKPLVAKLGIKPAHRLALLEAPRGFELEDLPEGVVPVPALGRVHDVILLFVTSRAQLEKRFAAAAKRLDPAGALWVSWPKRASGVETDVTEDVVREVALAAGLVDVKVCAVDETWSGLKCVIRVKDRPGKKKPRS